MKSALIYLRTIRYLTVRQILYRIWYRMLRFYPESFDLSKTTVHPLFSYGIASRLAQLPCREDAALLWPDGKLELLNRTLFLPSHNNGFKFPWESGATDRLLNISIHYHSWLSSIHVTGLPPITAALSLSNWIDQYSDSTGAKNTLATSPYAVGRRLEEWSRFLGRHSDEIPKDLLNKIVKSLSAQYGYLKKNIEWDIDGNHLLFSCFVTALGSLLFSQDTQTIQEAFSQYTDELNRQFLPNGIHYELSPMYHFLMLRDALIIKELCSDESLKTKISHIAASAGQYLREILHPDGNIPLINDSALLDTKLLGEVLSLLPTQSPHIASGAPIGIYAKRKSQFVLVVHGAPPAPSHQPGHAHASIGSFELSIGTTRVIVDPGCFHYDDSSIRAKDRATASHNTVSLSDFENSSEMWSIFRVGKRAVLESFVEEDDNITVKYLFSSSSGATITHKRVFSIQESGISISDVVSSSEMLASAPIINLLFSPYVSLKENGAGFHITSKENWTASVSIEPFLEGPSKTTAPYHPYFHVELNGTKVRSRMGEGSHKSTFVYHGTTTIEVSFEL